MKLTPFRPRPLLFLLLFFPFLAVLGLAEVTPWLVATGKAGNPRNAPVTYTVPAGKVFIIESVQHHAIDGGLQEGETVTIQAYRTLKNTNSNIPIYMNIGAYKRNDVYHLENPLRLEEGEFLSSNNVAFGFSFYWGLLVDREDLFAHLDVELKDPKIEGDKLKALATVSPARPYRLTVESATDLAQFSPEPGATITSTGKSTEKEIAVDTGTGAKKFVRATALARPR